MTVWIVLAVAALAAAVFVALYNRLVALRNEVEGSWRQIDVQLQRRYDLIPNLVETVKGYAEHEAGTLESVTRARSHADDARRGGDPAGIARADAQLGQALAKIDAVVEAYPDLAADRRFGQLMTELSNTENQVAASRRIYNASAETFNTAIEQMPAALIARLAGFGRKVYFKLADDAPERAAPKVSFS